MKSISERFFAWKYQNVENSNLEKIHIQSGFFPKKAKCVSPQDQFNIVYFDFKNIWYQKIFLWTCFSFPNQKSIDETNLVKELVQISTCTIYVNNENIYIKTHASITSCFTGVEIQQKKKYTNRMKIANKSANINNWIETMNKNRGGKCCIEKMSSEFLTKHTTKETKERDKKRERNANVK